MMLFCDTLFSIVLWRFIGGMYEGEWMDFKNRHNTPVTRVSNHAVEI